MVFDFEERDVFLGEVYCPGCAGRVTKKFPTRGKARRAHRSARVYQEPKRAAVSS